MPRTNLPYTAQDVKTIFYMKNKGYTFKEIGDAVHRSTRAIKNFLMMYRPAEQKTFQEPAEEAKTIMPDLLAALDEIQDKAPGFTDTMTVSEEPKEQPEPEIANEWQDFPEEWGIRTETPEVEKETVVETKIETVYERVSLDEYDVEEMLENIYKRGYRIRNNKFVHEVIVDFNNLKNDE